MLRFLCRLILAMLAERFIYRIATPEMRFRWAKVRMVRRMARALEAAVEPMRELTRAAESAAEGCAGVLDSLESQEPSRWPERTE